MIIYRQDAIDAAIEAADDWDGGCSKERDRFIRDALEELPSTQPDNSVAKIADLVEGSIDHFDLDDAMDLLYQIKEVLQHG